MKTKIVPFDLETAKKIQAGEIEGKIKTVGGENARIICWDVKNEHHTPIVVLIDKKQREEFYFYSEAGEYDFGSFPMRNLVLEIPDSESPFKPFDRVLVRDEDDDFWRATFFSHYNGHDKSFPYFTSSGYYAQCISFEGNQELLGTTNKPKED